MSNLFILGDYSAEMAKGNYDAVYQYFSDSFFSHVTERVHPEQVGTDIRYREREFWEMSKKAFPDMDFRVDLVLESGDHVVANWTIIGTHSGGDYYGVPPSGKRVEINGTAILRFENGKVAEHWGGPHCPRGVGLS
jgi:predicted ester cyclase